MEIDSLKEEWNRVNSQIDKIEDFDANIIENLILKNSHKKLLAIKSRFIFSLIVGFVGLLIIIFAKTRIDNLRWEVVLGLVLFSQYMILSMIYIARMILDINKIDFSTDAIVITHRKVTTFKKLEKRWSHIDFYLWPLAFTGLVLIFYNNSSFKAPAFIIIILLFIITSYLKYKDTIRKKNELNSIEEEVKIVSEYF